ncbi:uncharacterized protein VTP21DRAFT_8708 [Calcarisporiella thermophila]|uniref:uncharacterized protein n=1 Tax=Calcarisporiella thermophila TaxID=911321 RepID=UPI0037422455
MPDSLFGSDASDNEDHHTSKIAQTRDNAHAPEPSPNNGDFPSVNDTDRMAADPQSDAEAASPRSVQSNLFGSEDSDVEDGAPAPADAASFENSKSNDLFEGKENEDDASAKHAERKLRDDLFGSDDEDEKEDEDDMMERRREKEKERFQYPMEDEEDMSEEEQEEEKVGYIEMVDGKPPRSSEDKYYFCKLPKFLYTETAPFDSDAYEPYEPEEEERISSASQRIKLLVENTIRWRERMDENGNMVKQSNARFVRWSDGSTSLLLGDELFQVTTAETTKNDHLFLASVRRANAQILGTDVALTHHMMFKPYGTSSQTHLKLTAAIAGKHSKSVKARMHNLLEDPEKIKLEMEKREAERLKMLRKQENQQRARAARYSVGMPGSRADVFRDYGDLPLRRVGRFATEDGYDEDDFVVGDEEEEEDEEAERRKADRLNHLKRSGMERYKERREAEEEEEEEEEDDEDFVAGGEEEGDEGGEEEEEEEEEEERVERRMDTRRRSPTKRRTPEPEFEAGEEVEEEDEEERVMMRKGKRRRVLSEDEDE